MKRVSDLIDAVRSDSRNETAPSDVSRQGVSDKQICRHLNYGYERLQGVITRTNPGVFKKDYIFNTIPLQEEYAIPDRIFSGERITNVQYSYTGNTRDFRDLRLRGENNRLTENGPSPSFYIKRSGSILLNPIPNTALGKIRVVYERQPDTLSYLRYPVFSIDTGSSPQTIIVEAPNLSTSSPEYPDVAGAYWLCAQTDRDGTPIAYNIPVTLTLFDTGVIPYQLTYSVVGSISSYLTPAYTVATSLLGNYCTIGKWSSYYTTLPDICDRYVEMYATYKAFKLDSSNDAAEAKQELSDMEQDIERTFQDASRDENDIQISDASMVIKGDWEYP